MEKEKNELRGMTWKEIEKAFENNPVILIPLGSMEEHGPHSVVGDYIAAERVARSIAEKTEAYMTPVIPFGYSEYFRSYPGTISFRPETFFMVIQDMCQSLIEHGITKILFVNGHGGNSALIEMLGRKLRREKQVMVGKYDIWQTMTLEMKKNLYGENADKAMGHGGEPVTSVMHYLNPENMRMDLAGTEDRKKTWQEFDMYSVGKTKILGTEAMIYFDMSDMTSRGCLADPYIGDKEKGQVIYERMVEVGIEFVHRMERSDMTKLPG